MRCFLSNEEDKYQAETDALNTIYDSNNDKLDSLYVKFPIATSG